jgi:hypothetical protein
MNQSANTRSGPLEHDINASREPRTDLFDLVSTPAAADWKPRAHLELMISMAATVIFWTADLRVTASTRIGAPPPSSWQRPRRAGALARRVGALTRLIKETAALATW